MELKQYQEEALRTESRVETVDGICAPSLYSALQASVSVGGVLDIMKKHIFYGKPVDTNTALNQIEIAIDTLNDLRQDFQNGSIHDTDRVEMFEYQTTFFTEIGPKSLSVQNPRILHVALGLATESSEILEAIINQMHGEPLDLVNLSEEIGDINWYANGIFPDASGISYNKYLQTNIAKLAVRYPEKFTAWLALDENRDLVKERKELEAATR